MPSAANTRQSRRSNRNGRPVEAATANITVAASRKLAASTSNGGQSATASLATEKAEAQSNAKTATSTGNGNGNDNRNTGSRAALAPKLKCAVRMGHVLSRDPDRVAHCNLEIK